MTFEDLKSRVRAFFAQEKQAVVSRHSEAIKARIKANSIEAFKRQNKTNSFVHKGFYWRYWVQASLGVLILGFGFYRLPAIQASDVLVKNIEGPIEIIRGDSTFLVRHEMELLDGDIIRVGSRGLAEIQSNDDLFFAHNTSEIHIRDKNNLFLKHGKIRFEGDNFEIQTHRGRIQSFEKTAGHIDVNQTGETMVVAKAPVTVFDNKKGIKDLSSGEKITLRTDTILAETAPLTKLKLSDKQIRSIDSTFTIARTKLFTAIDLYINNKNKDAQLRLLSGRNTFLSSLEILASDRMLNERISLDFSSESTNQVISELINRNAPKRLIEEARAIETLLHIVEKSRGNLNINPLPTYSQNKSFYRAYLAQNLLADTPALADVFFDDYVSSFLQKFQNQELRITQIATLNNAVDELPVNLMAKKFLEKVAEKSAPDIQKLLTEKIQKLYP